MSHADVFTVELRRKRDNGKILEDGFRIEHFTFNDQYEVINKKPFPGTCEPRKALYPRRAMELQSSKSPITRQMLDDVYLLSDPIRQARSWTWISYHAGATDNVVFRRKQRRALPWQEHYSSQGSTGGQNDGPSKYVRIGAEGRGLAPHSKASPHQSYWTGSTMVKIRARELTLGRKLT